jgi:hypothetical protein
MPSAQEKVGPGEYGMLVPICVTPRSRGDRMDPMARIDYGLPAADFGQIHEDSKGQFLHQWRYVVSMLHQNVGQRQSCDGLQRPEEACSKGKLSDQDDLLERKQSYRNILRDVDSVEALDNLAATGSAEAAGVLEAEEAV